MTTPLTTARNRTVVAAVLAGGLLTSLSACGGSTTSATPVSEATPIQGSPLVACGMAQLSPRVADGDPVLGRANNFFNQLQQAQLVPPAVQSVYNTDVAGLTPDQKHEVLLMLSSLNECPGLSPALQQSVLDAFDQLAPQTVADPSTADSSSSSSGGQTVIIRSDDTTVDDSSSSDHLRWDGDWNGRPWWFRPIWDHPVTDTADWVQWGTDRRAGVVWRWADNGWQRVGRPTDAPANRPWLPREIGSGRLNHDPGTAPGSTQFQVPGGQPPAGVPQPAASAQSNVPGPQQPTRPGFRDTPPNTVTGGATVTTQTPAPGSDQQPARTTTDSGSNSNTTTHGNSSSTTPDTRSGSSGNSNASPAPTRHPDTTTGTQPRDSDSTGVQGDMSTRTDHRHDPNAG